jgi:hypothetical protein
MKEQQHRDWTPQLGFLMGKMLAKRQDDMQNLNLQLGSLFIGHIITISKEKRG